MEVMVEKRTVELKRVIELLQEEIRVRKKVEEALKKSEDRFRQVAENAREWIWEVDREGLYIYSSPVVEDILGYKPEELVGKKHFYDLFHPEEGEKMRELAFEVFSKRETFREFVTPNIHKNGKTVWLSTSGVPIFDENGEFIGYRGADIDITERIKAEEQIKISLRENEILLREIHHRVKNNMQIVCSLFNLHKNSIKDKEAYQIILECQNRIRAMALVHEKLYRTESFSDVNLKEYIRDMVNNLIEFYEVNPDKIVLKIDIEDNILLDINSAIPCGLIVNELITNSLQYAFPGGMKGEINIKVRLIDNEIRMSITDNGIGLPADFHKKKTESMGFFIIDTLIRQLNGKIEIRGNNGAKIFISFRRKT
jgi:PAS domain S-box-containing protein